MLTDNDKHSSNMKEQRLDILQKVANGELTPKQADKQLLGIGAVIGWVSVSDELPKEHKHRMSRDVLTIAGNKMSVKSYDFELGRWNGSPHITVTHWMELPSPPSR